MPELLKAQTIFFLRISLHLFENPYFRGLAKGGDCIFGNFFISF